MPRPAPPLCIGVLALQGAFAKHVAMFRALGVQAREIRRPEELAGCAALTIPGGESTTITKQMAFIGLDTAIAEFAETHPLFGTCAGLIVMASKVEGGAVPSFSLLDITVARNAYGRQNESFTTQIPFLSQETPIPATFIRAPRIVNVGPAVQILASYHNEPILVQQGRHLGASFHPELTSDTAVHQYFLSLLKN